MKSLKTNSLNKRKPFKLLALFSGSELEKFHHFLRYSSLEIPKSTAQKLLRYYERVLALQVTSQPVTKEEFIAGTELPTSANAFDKLTSLFYDRMQEYLACQELKSDVTARQQLAFRAYQARPVEHKEIRRRYQEAQREMDKLPQSSQLINSRWSLELDMATQTNDRSIPTSERGYTDLLNSLEANYATQKLRLLCAIANDQRIFDNQSDHSLVPPSLPAEEKDWPELAFLYYHVFLVLTGKENDASIQALYQRLDAQDVHAATYPQADMLDLYGYLLNALTKQVNRGNPHALQRLSQLYDHLIAHEILLDNGTISPEHFKNVISAKLKTGEIKQARAHFELLAPIISNDPDHNASRYNHAIILYLEGKLAEAAEQLENLCDQIGNVKLDHFYGLDMRVYLLMVYFDLLDHVHPSPAAWDLVDEKIVLLLEAFKSYIERRKIPQKRKESYEDFRKLMQMAYNFTYRHSHHTPETKRTLLEIELQKENNASSAVWFRDRFGRMDHSPHA